MKDNTKDNEPQETALNEQAAKLEAEAQVIEEQAEAIKKEEQQLRSEVVATTASSPNVLDVNTQLHKIKGKVSLLTAITVLIIAGAAAGGFLLTAELNKAVTEANTLKVQSHDAGVRADKILATFTEQSARISELLAANDKLDDENKALKAEIAAFTSRLDTTDKKLDSTATALSQYEERNPNDWKLAQSYFLVNSAYQAAVFQSDPTTAIWCLKDADSMLVNIEDQDVIAVRKAISSDLVKLANIPSIDKRGIMFKLDSVCENLNAMTLNGMEDSFGNKNKAKQEDEALVSDITNWQSNLWRALKDFSSRFVEIRRRNDSALSEYLSSSQEEILRENIRSLLLLSKQGLTHSNAEAFKSNINQAIALINSYYDASSEAVKANLAALESIKDLQVVVDVPSVLSSYTMFRDLASSKIKVISPAVTTDATSNTQDNGSTK